MSSPGSGMSEGTADRVLEAAPGTGPEGTTLIVSTVIRHNRPEMRYVNSPVTSSVTCIHPAPPPSLHAARPACRGVRAGCNCCGRRRTSSSRRATTPPRWTTSPSARASASRCCTSTSPASWSCTWRCSTSTSPSSPTGSREAMARHRRQPRAGRRRASGAYFDFVDAEGEAFRLVFESDLRNEPAVRERVDRGTAGVRRGDRRDHRGRHRRSTRSGPSCWPPG